MEENYRTFYITNFMNENEMSKTEFARFVGISVYVLNRILNQKAVSLRFLFRIIKKLDLEFDEFLI